MVEPNREHAGRYIGTYYWQVAYPSFDMPADASAESGFNGISVAHHDLGDTRLTTIRYPYGQAWSGRYMRFINLAAGISGEERRILSFPVFTDSENDLIIACPGTTDIIKSFQIVPSEVMHSAHESALCQRSTESFSHQRDNRWASIYSDQYMGGIYRPDNSASGLQDLSKQLPATVEACLSVSNLVMRNAEVVFRLDSSANS